MRYFIMLVGRLLQLSCANIKVHDQCIEPSIDGYLIHGPLTEAKAVAYFKEKMNKVPYLEIFEWFNAKNKNECIYVLDSPEEDWRRLAGRFGLISTIDGEVIRSRVFVRN